MEGGSQCPLVGQRGWQGEKGWGRWWWWWWEWRSRLCLWRRWWSRSGWGRWCGQRMACSWKRPCLAHSRASTKNIWVFKPFKAEFTTNIWYGMRTWEDSQVGWSLPQLSPQVQPSAFHIINCRMYTSKIDNSLISSEHIHLNVHFISWMVETPATKLPTTAWATMRLKRSFYYLFGSAFGWAAFGMEQSHVDYGKQQGYLCCSQSWGILGLGCVAFNIIYWPHYFFGPTISSNLPQNQKKNV